MEKDAKTRAASKKAQQAMREARNILPVSNDKLAEKINADAKKKLVYDSARHDVTSLSDLSSVERILVEGVKYRGDELV